MTYDKQQLQRIIEGAIMAAGEPLNTARLISLFEENEAPEKSEIEEVLSAIRSQCEQRGFDLIEVASGWRFQVRKEIAPWVNRLWQEKPQKYSRAMMETIALIAYRQPLTRGDIEEVRGVAVSSHIIKTLSERGWVKIVGNRDVPGRPALYATTKTFLDHFNLKSLEELPTLGELKDIDSLNASLDFGNNESTPEDAPSTEQTEAGQEDKTPDTLNDSQEPIDASDDTDNNEGGQAELDMSISIDTIDTKEAPENTAENVAEAITETAENTVAELQASESPVDSVSDQNKTEDGVIKLTLEQALEAEAQDDIDNEETELDNIKDREETSETEKTVHTEPESKPQDDETEPDGYDPGALSSALPSLFEAEGNNIETHNAETHNSKNSDTENNITDSPEPSEASTSDNTQDSDNAQQ